MIEPFSVLNVVDYGDVGTDPFHLVRSQSELRLITREFAETGAIPLAIGGDHSVPTGAYRGVADVYGYKKVALVHFDAHLDWSYVGYGSYVHSACMTTCNARDGYLDIKDAIHVGMGAINYGENYYDEAREQGIAAIHSNHEIQRDGMKVVMDRILKKLEGKDLVYVTFDIDVFDMSYAPGTGSSEPTGLSPNELFPQIRRLFATKRIVGADIVEYNPHMDNKGMQTARLVRRVAIQMIGGIAMKAYGLDPEYVNPHLTGELNK